jgi:hypothetical protein
MVEASHLGTHKPESSYQLAPQIGPVVAACANVAGMLLAIAAVIVSLLVVTDVRSFIRHG